VRFTNRKKAGQLLAKKLEHYRDQDPIVYALPRGGVVLAADIARHIGADLDLVITRKIGHPAEPEYAIAAITEDGSMVTNPQEISEVGKVWLEHQKKAEMQEAKRRRQLYMKGKPHKNAKSKIAIIVDDGIATGFTMRAAVIKLKKQEPKKIVVAVPVTPRSTADTLRREADEVIALDIPSDYGYLGAVGAYYDEFYQVSDKQVIEILSGFK